jgi:hypothetical protein
VPEEEKTMFIMTVKQLLQRKKQDNLLVSVVILVGGDVVQGNPDRVTRTFIIFSAVQRVSDQ